MVELALFEPEIPHNTGALMRLGACLGITLNVIEPLGFVLTDKHLKRASMDYRDLAALKMHDHFQAFLDYAYARDHAGDRPMKRVVLFDTKGATDLYDFTFTPHDILLFGKESSGVPDAVFNQIEHTVHIKMKPDCRSLNLALTAAMGVTEAMRQCRCFVERV